MTWAYTFDRPLQLDHAGLTALLGGKGANLTVMADTLGLPVPPGFVITTAACQAFRSDGWPQSLDVEMRALMARIEDQVGRRFGDPRDPLLVSVRSGAPVSMPGMLDTILNLGLNTATTAGLAAAAGDAAFAAACRGRLEAMYRDIVAPVLPEDPWQQLRAAVEAVFRSWDGERARHYREREGIDADLGTAVVVQAMVFGNRGPDSATGVLFTRDPATGEDTLYGDVLFGAQGEDVVAGTHATQHISVLEARLPSVAAQLRTYADRLERHFRDVCDIEFTIEEGRLWMLQTRIGKRTARAACRIALEMAEDGSFPLSRREAVERVAHLLVDPLVVVAEASAADVPVVARGLGASPGLVSGAVATTPETAVRMADAGTAVLLVRAETSPDDVHGMARSVGILTSTGGLACHAAVVARGWDIPAVVGASSIVVADGVVTIAGRTWREGDILSIDGASGEVFGGAVEALTTIAPEAAILLRWAAELGIDIGDREEREMAEGRTAAGVGEVTRDDVIRALVIKGYVTPELLAPALVVSSEGAAQLLDGLAADGIAAASSGMFSLTPEGKEMGAEMLARDRDAWGVVSAAAALDGFIALDGRMKTIVTAWQLREVDGRQVLNDHADATYDARVLDDLAALHVDASAWITPLTAGLPRLARYRLRLDAAVAAALAGDPLFIASPRVDSYHGVWFELHEDLIRLAGRTREEEVAAGRA